MAARMSPLGLILILAGASLTCCGLAAGAADDARALQDHYLIHVDCLNALNEQISWELYASIVYLNMAGYFDRPSVARTGFARFFRAQSLEEYEHAGKFIDYINARNGTVKRISVDESAKNEWLSPREALADAIKLEKYVYAKIQYAHEVATQKCQDGHLTDFLESHFFTEQVESIRELQTMLTKVEVADAAALAVIEHLEDERLRKALKSSAGAGSKHDEL